MTQRPPGFYVIMGVSGSGKTTIGQALARALHCSFYDGDDFHSPESVAKMASGQPLDDADRAPWLATLAGLIQEHLDGGKVGVLASSALKKQYRDQLAVADNVQFVFLDGDFDLISQRMLAREDHYMKPAMLRSQFETLERPDETEALILSIEEPVDVIIERIQQVAL